MYLAPGILLLILFAGLGWWLKAREDRSDALDNVEIAQSDARLVGLLRQDDSHHIIDLVEEIRRLKERNTNLEASNANARNVLWTLLERAEARYKPYADFDWLILSQRMDPEDYRLLCADADDARDNFNLLVNALNYQAQLPPRVAQG